MEDPSSDGRRKLGPKPVKVRVLGVQG